LRGEGLLSNGTKGGYFFPKVDQAGVESILEVRLVLESGAIRLATQRAADEQLNRLAEIVDDMEKMALNGYHLGFVAADLHFHECLIDLAGNSKLKSLYGKSNLPLTINLYQINTDTKNEMVGDVKDHRKIAEAVIGRDADKAIRLLKKGMHLSKIKW
jgi:DNA-binding GntR family transcriptional regulator